MTEKTLRLGVNIDHVATLRNARGGDNPDPVRAALAAQAAGADGITAHLREDRRHIRDADIHALKDAISLPLNFEMAATGEMVDIACEIKPNAACIVPERREEVTTEGGLAVAGREAELAPFFNRIRESGIRLSLFIEASEAEIRAAAAVGADIVELHTGRYCHDVASRASELTRINEAAALADSLGLECHAGHGLDYDTVAAIAAIPQMHELNIGHFLMGESLFVGFDAAIGRMRRLMDEARTS
jgi:pyridoxine 5-phosphate synthase